MPSALSEIHFSNLIDICSEPENQEYERAWKEFERRYGNKMREMVLMSGRVKGKEQANGVLSEVRYILVKNNFSTFKIFKKRHDENSFRAYLGTICRMAAFGIRAPNTEPLPEIAIEEDLRPNERHSQRRIARLTRESLLRQHKKDLKVIERDVLVHLLKEVYDLSAREIACLPLLNINEAHVPRIIYRARQAIRKNKPLERFPMDGDTIR